MTIRQALAEGAERLARAGIEEAKLDAALLLAHLTGEERLRMQLDAGRELAPERYATYDAMLRRRQAREPLQYIVGETEFMGLTFAVRPGALIPRQDTEILCEQALLRLTPGMRVLDIGTGSGALAVSLARLCPGALVTAVDVSEEALSLARENAARLGACVRFVRSDCFSALGGERFDMIVSNPPYIPPWEMAELMPEVRFEPELALDGGEDGLAFYRRIASQAREHLLPGGFLMFEIGWQQRDDVSAIVKEHIGEPFALRDYGGNWRVVGAALAKRPPEDGE
ncbi:MAG: peptide chain release factor N(5)-glutamine methyltransferase [Clostridia bacterium]|nr:peptide chain release factor N(5)-glutamine methyltransferase [Clostridia bacterium]